MAKIKFTLHGIAAEIRKAEKQLRALRSKVSKAEQKKIDLELRALAKSYHLIRVICLPSPMRPLFGQLFTTKAK
jgi:hypothetical protein